jgi:beta-mannosidase
MRWLSSDARLPGAHKTHPLSRFSGLERAATAAIVRIRETAWPGSGPVRLALATGWDRAVDPAAARTRETASSPPPRSAAWHPVEVPDNYGCDPDLRSYFGPVWYRRTLTRRDAGFVDLVFAAVDYLADVWIDGTHLGRHEGYFAPFLFDVTGHLPPARGAELLVRVQDPLESLPDRRLFIRHRKRWIKGVMNYHDSRYGGMPGSMTRGWTFEIGQSPPTGGIVGPVTLEHTGPLRLDAVFVTPLDMSGRVHVALLLQSRAAADVEAVAHVRIVRPDGELLPAVAIDISTPPGPSRLDIETSIPEPVLWWDAALPERGGPALYRAEVVISAGEGVSDARETSFGLRSAEFPAEPRWHYRLNGEPVFIRGANYIPVQHWAGLDEGFYARDFTLMRRAHLHAAGVHAHVQAPACYDAADRAGISLFQDFPLQWSYASGTGEDPTFVPRATAMAAEMAYLLWNHPSVVTYTAHNEPLHALRELIGASIRERQATASTLMKGLLGVGRLFMDHVMFRASNPDDPTHDTANLCLDRRLVETLRTVDPLRFVHLGSGAGHDTHDYSGTIAGGRVSDVGRVRAPFVSEYGSFPVTRRALGRQDEWASPWPPGRKQVEELCRQGLIPFELLSALGDFSRYRELTAFASAAERKAAFVAKHQTEFFRIHRHAPYTGCRWHFFVNHWGYMGGGLLDVDRAPTLAYDAIRAALRPRLVAAQLAETVFETAPAQVPVWAINDTRTTWDVRAEWRFERLRVCEVLRGERARAARAYLPRAEGTYVLSVPEAGSIVASGALSGSCRSNETVRLGDVSPSHSGPGGYRLTLEWDGETGREQNEFTFLVAEPGWKPRPGLNRVTIPR